MAPILFGADIRAEVRATISTATLPQRAETRPGPA
jgi:hypothetical protein